MDGNKKTVRVAAAVIRDGGRVFATQRGYGPWKDWWEFPGGKIEAGETPEEALAREIREELATDIAVGLTLRDVWLDYFREHKASILRLRSGDSLRYTNGYLATMQGECIACLSRSKRQAMDDLRKRGYTVDTAVVSYILAWRPREETEEVAVCLANLILKKQTNTTI